MAFRLAVAFLIVVSFFISCCLPAYYGRGGFMEEGTEIFGGMLLLVGWTGLSNEVLPWLANPLLLVGLLCFLAAKDAASAIFSALSFGAALSLLAFGVPSGVRFGNPMAIVISEQVELRIGYLLWTLTPLCLFAFSLLAYFLQIGSTRTRDLPTSTTTSAPAARSAS